MAPELDPTAEWRRWQQAVMTLQLRAYPASAVEAGAPPGAEPGAPPLTRRALEAQLATRDRQLADREQRIADLTVAVTRERETRQRDVRLLELMLNALREEVSYLHRQPPPCSPPAPLPPTLFKQLRSLCHPDRWHGLPQEQTALEVMQWLNRLPSRP